MSSVTIDLRDGFRDDTVAVEVAGRRAAERAGLTTDLRVSLADSLTIDAPDEPFSVRVEVAGRGLAAEVEVDPRAGERFVLADIRDGELRVSATAQQPFYA